MRQLRIYFTDFWNGFNADNIIAKIFLDIFPNAIYLNEPNEVDLCVYSCFGNNNKCVDARFKISYMGEPHGQFGYLDNADLNIGFDEKHIKDFRFPLWKFTLLGSYLNSFNYNKITDLMKSRTNKLIDTTNILPISALYRQYSGIRNSLLPILINDNLCANYGNAYLSHVISKDYKNYSRINNTINPNNYVTIGNVDKKKIIEMHPYHLALENSQEEGYITEKLFEPLYYGSVPFYWGDKKYSEIDFNPNAFISLAHFNINEGDKAAAYIKNIISQKNIYTEMQKAPIFINIPEYAPLYDAVRNVVTGYY